MLSNQEAGRNPDEATLVTDATDSFTGVVIVIVGEDKKVISRRLFPYTVSYHPDGSFGIISSKANVLFRPVKGQEEGQREMIRDVFLPDDLRVVGTERSLSYSEIVSLMDLAENPRVDLMESFGLLELSPDEQLELERKQVELAVIRQEIEGEASQAATAARSGGMLKSASVFRPGSRE